MLFLNGLIRSITALLRPKKQVPPMAPGTEPETPSSIPRVDPPAAAASAPEEPDYSRIAFFRSKENIYLDEAIVTLANRCKAGDTDAMLEMAAFFRGRCVLPALEVLGRYEAAPTNVHADELRSFMKRETYESIPAAAYMMWISRAAFFGSAPAARLLGQCPLYGELALIPHRLLEGSSSGYLRPYSSDVLYNAGLIDVPTGYNPEGLRYDRNRACFCLTCESGYEPPDEDGFGAEWEYEDLWFDLLFNRLPDQ